MLNCFACKCWEVKSRHALQLFALLSTHVDRQGVDISFTVCLFFVCNFVRLQISLLGINLVVSNLHGGSSASKAGNSTFWGTLLPQKPKIGRVGA